MRVLEENDTCEVACCTRQAEGMAYSRSLRKVILVCSMCEPFVVAEGTPEYVHTCENCGCSIPIN